MGAIHLTTQRTAAATRAVRGYPDLVDPSGIAVDGATVLFLPMDYTTVDAHELSFFSTLATFGTALDFTPAERSIEALFPADDATRSFLQAS